MCYERIYLIKIQHWSITFLCALIALTIKFELQILKYRVSAMCRLFQNPQTWDVITGRDGASWIRIQNRLVNDHSGT
jgi:hypothetical protein